MSYAKKYISGGLWTLLGTGISRMTATVVMMIVAHYQGASEFGKIGLIQNSLGTVGALIGLGLSTTSLRYTASLKNTDSGALSNLIDFIKAIAYIIGSISVIFIAFFSDEISIILNGDNRLKNLLILAIPYVFFNLMSGLQSGRIIGYSDFRNLAKIQLTDAAMWFFLVLSLSIEYGAFGFCLGLSIKAIITWVQGEIYLNAHDSRRSRIFDSLKYKNNWSIFWNFSIPATITNISTAPVSLYGQSLVARERGHAELGLYFAASQINFLVTAFMTVFSQVSTSLLSETFDEKNSRLFTRRLEKNFRMSMYAALGMASVMYLFKERIFSLFGAEYQVGAEILSYTITAAVVSVGQFCVAQFYIGSGKMWQSLVCQILWVVVFLLIIASGWDRYSSLALSIAFFAANLSAFMLQIALASYLNKNIRVTSFLVPLMLGGIMFYGYFIKQSVAIYFTIVLALIFALYEINNRGTIEKEKSVK